MILAIDKYGALYVFASAKDAEQYLEAIDVQNDTFEFCDISGHRYVVNYIRPPKESRFLVDIGSFKLVSEKSVEVGLSKSFVERARHIEHTTIPGIDNIETLRKESNC